MNNYFLLTLLTGLSCFNWHKIIWNLYLVQNCMESSSHEGKSVASPRSQTTIFANNLDLWPPTSKIYKVHFLPWTRSRHKIGSVLFWVGFNQISTGNGVGYIVFTGFTGLKELHMNGNTDRRTELLVYPAPRSAVRGDKNRFILHFQCILIGEERHSSIWRRVEIFTMWLHLHEWVVLVSSSLNKWYERQYVPISWNILTCRRLVS